MFVPEEISKSWSLYNGIRHESLDSFLESDELEAIGEKNTAFQNLQNRLVEPRKLNRHSTLTFQRLHNHSEFDEWLKSIANCLLFSEYTHIRIGFSFISWKPLTGEKIYLYAARALCSFSFFCDTKSECLTEFAAIGKMSDSQLLHETFLENEIESDPFSSSGFCPLKLVCSYVWVTK